MPNNTIGTMLHYLWRAEHLVYDVIADPLELHEIRKRVSMLIVAIFALTMGTGKAK